MGNLNQRKYSAQYRLMYDYGEGPVVIYEACDEQDAIQQKKRLIARDNIYPVIFRSNGGRDGEQLPESPLAHGENRP